MAQVPKISGPAAAMFDEAPPQNYDENEIFARGQQSPTELRLEIIEARLNEFYDFLIKANANNFRLLHVNALHRNPLDAGLNAQDASRINHTGIRK